MKKLFGVKDEDVYPVDSKFLRESFSISKAAKHSLILVAFSVGDDTGVSCPSTIFEEEEV